MAKREKGTRQARGGATAPNAPGVTAADALEQRVVAFAEQLGRMIGTVQAKAEGWMDRDALHRQIAGVRDGAAHLLEQLADAAKAPKKKAAPAAKRRVNKGRSGGAVDAPGKKHRKPAPADPGANIADSQADKMRMARPMAKTNRRRGRG